MLQVTQFQTDPHYAKKVFKKKYIKLPRKVNHVTSVEFSPAVIFTELVLNLHFFKQVLRKQTPTYADRNADSLQTAILPPTTLQESLLRGLEGDPVLDWGEAG